VWLLLDSLAAFFCRVVRSFAVGGIKLTRRPGFVIGQKRRSTLDTIAQQELAAGFDHRLAVIGDDVGDRVGFAPQLGEVGAGADHIEWGVGDRHHPAFRRPEARNVLSPRHVATLGLSNLMTDEQKLSAIASVPLSRIGTADDLGRAAVFLASDDSAYITSIELFVDGGVAQI
jgi:Enoyl-(Acyl carrier protein) reductase